MKKVVSIILALALIASFSSMVYADDSAGSGESQIYAHVYSSYTITIPATIDLRNGENGVVTISDASIEEGYAVNVYVTNSDVNGVIYLRHADGISSISCQILNEEGSFATEETPLVSFAASDIQAATATKNFTLQADTFGIAGEYSGTMTYSFRCEPTT